MSSSLRDDWKDPIETSTMKRHLSNDHMLLTNSLKVEIDDKNGSIHKGTDS